MSTVLTTLLLASLGALPGGGPLYPLQPISKVAKPVAAAHAVLRTRASEADLQKAQTGLAAWLAQPARDVHAHDAGLWLDGELLLRLGKLDEARARLKTLSAQRSTLADPLRERMAARKDATDGDLLEALAVCPRTSTFASACRQVEARLAKRGRHAATAARLADVLLEPMSFWRRTQLLKMRKARLAAAGDTAAAARLAARLWWRSGHRKTAPSTEAYWARRVFNASGKAAVRTLDRALRKVDAKVMDANVRAVLGGVLLGTRKKDRAAAHTAVTAAAAKLYEGSHAVIAWYATALARRRVDDDLAAVEAYRKVFEDHPEHPLANDARREAAWLLLRRGFPTDARALHAQLADEAAWGSPNRDGLWHDGVAAFMAGEYGIAAKRFEQLGLRYGGQREGYGLPWAARAHYWQARALDKADQPAEARAVFRGVETGFPMSWYAMLSRKQLQAMAVAGRIDAFAEVGPRLAARGRRRGRRRAIQKEVVRRPHLDLAVAYWRLGDPKKSQDVLETLSKTRQLYDSARLLLADLKLASGDKAGAERLVIGSGTWAKAPDKRDTKVFKSAYPMPYRKQIRRHAQRNRYAPGFLAGLIHVESRFNPRVKSGAGAVGLTQLMYRTAKSVAKHLLKRTRLRKRDLYKAKTNLQIGSRFLRELYEHFGRNPALAAAAYNAGHGAVRGWLKQRGHLPTDLFVELIPYDQARNYVRRVVTMSEMFRTLHKLPGASLDVPLTLPLTLGPFFEEKG